MREKSPRINREKSPLDNPVVERSFNILPERGNIFLDQPIQQGSFIKLNEICGRLGYLPPHNSYEIKKVKN